MLFSVLIPLYNAEKYIQETVESIINQTEQDFEIIIMDDSSTDNSAKICRELENRHPNKIRFYQQENKGVLLARRDLAQLAKGDYLMYVDSDDLLKNDALQLIKKTIADTDADMVLYDLKKISDKGDELYTMPLENGKEFSMDNKKEVLRMLLLTKYMYSMCQKVFRRECFDFKVDYSEYRGMRVAEDAFQSYPIMDKAQKIVYLKEALYLYRKNSGGATAKVIIDDIRWQRFLFLRENEYINKWDICDEDVKRVSETRVKKILVFLSLIMKTKRDEIGYKGCKKLIYEIINDELFINAVKKSDLKRLPKICRLDLMLIRLKLFRLLYLEKRFI